MDTQMRMGQGIQQRRPLSVAGFQQLVTAPRLKLEQNVIWGDVDLTDVSFWNKPINFAKMRSQGIAGTVIRAGQNTWEDNQWDVNWKNSKEAGILRGSYWFMDSRSGVKSQADLYSNLLKPDMGELMVTVDY